VGGEQETHSTPDGGLSDEDRAEIDEVTGHGRFLDHVNAESEVEILLRAHLWIEGELGAAIEAALPRPEAIDIRRMRFAQKVDLVTALGLLDPPIPPVVREQLTALNRLRNRLAHERDHDVNAAEALDALLADRLPEHMLLVVRDPNRDDKDHLRLLLYWLLLMTARIGYNAAEQRESTTGLLALAEQIRTAEEPKR
jgi:hypothetical protein